MSPFTPEPDHGLAAIASEAVEGRLTDPFAVFGPHGEGAKRVVRSFLPGAQSATLVNAKSGKIIAAMEDIGHGLFVGKLGRNRHYRLKIQWPDTVQETEDPYRFGVVLGDLDLHLFSEGRHRDLARNFGAVPRQIDGTQGVVFSVWAPNARRVSVVGDFNGWDGRRHPMRLRHDAGVWELFVPRLGPGERYKFEIAGANGAVVQKADPLARRTELPPATASIIEALPDFTWSDDDWMERRRAAQAPDRPMTIYEVHPGSWMKPGEDIHSTFGWRALAERLIPYVADLGFTHVEFLPIMEHPFAGSWGYQPLSQFAPSARFGTPEGFAHFVDAAHRAGIGVILDWVPAHFPTDAHGLATFDGTHLYEHADPREGFHQDWNTLIYNLGRREVAGFLLSSALWWAREFHVDGLRVDAVASMLYRDYSRKEGEWVPNVHGGRENLESIAFLRELNQRIAADGMGAITLAEESTAFPGVTAPVAEGGLGFDYKWNMGWMHDSLEYIARDPVHRAWHHNEITFSLVYSFSEKFVLPISHDEVVHGKGSLLGKMPGDEWRRFANLRAYYAFMWTHPGKKLLFMGCELGQPTEWNHDAQLPWELLEDARHAGIQRLVRDLNRLHVDEGALHARDADPAHFDWIIGNDSTNSVLVWQREGRQGDPPLVIAANLTPEPQHDYRVGVPRRGTWQEILNSDAEIYGGSGTGNGGSVQTSDEPMHGRPASLSLALPPLGVIVLKPGDGA
ncbi:1,4-alpha-glucan branching protein GlgB [Erythrobacter sp.]|uniref:1,4-alpha-glucan branching protein GlgB n=1 Tax=Erythrobacter sp. TaxID=1042 RepID=UPI0025D25414|nr:1,4-alpha-glucan branching protein GlgB [Erythrobacter sp.]